MKERLPLSAHIGVALNTFYKQLVLQRPKTFLMIFGLYLLTVQAGYGQSRTYNFVASITKYRLALATAKTNADRAQIYFHLADNYSVTNEDSAVYFASQGVVVAQKLPDKHLLINLYGELGRSYESSGKISEGLAILKKAEQMSQQFYKDSTTALIQLMLANFYTKQGDDKKALPKALAALRYQEKYSPDKKLFQCKIYNSLGIINTNLKQYQQAIYYFDKLRETGATILGGFYVYLAAINVSDIYLRLNAFEKAEIAAKQALAKASELKSNRGIGFGLGQLAEIMYKTNHYQEAIEYGKQALQIRQQLSDKRLIGLSLTTLAEIYLALHQYDLALPYANQGVDVLRATNDRINTRHALEIQAQILEKTNDYRAALTAYKTAKALNDSLMNVDNAREVSRIQGTFNLERKQNQIELLNKNLAIQNLQGAQRQKQLLLLNQANAASELQNQLLVKKQQLNQSRLTLQAVTAKRQQALINQQQSQLAFARQQRLLYLVILVLLVGLIALISYFFRREKKAKRLLHAQKEELQQTAQALAEINAVKDKLFSLIGHDLRSPIASVKTNIRQIRKVDDQPQLLLPLMGRLEKQVDNVLTLLTNLLDWSMIQLKGFQLQLQPIHLHEITEETISQVSELIQQKQLVVIDQVDKALLIKADKHQFRAVVRNVVGNAIKFTPPGGYIRIQSVRQGETIELLISDTGIGMSAEQIDTLFQSPQVRAGTTGETGVGLGLRICRDMLDQQGGSLHVESHPKGGTRVRIRLAAFSEKPQPVLG